MEIPKRSASRGQSLILRIHQCVAGLSGKLVTVPGVEPPESNPESKNVRRISASGVRGNKTILNLIFSNFELDDPDTRPDRSNPS